MIILGLIRDERSETFNIIASGFVREFYVSRGHMHARAYQAQKSEGNLFRLAVVNHTYQGIVPGERHPHRVTTNPSLYHLP